jgi:hypothetical protein
VRQHHWLLRAQGCTSNDGVFPPSLAAQNSSATAEAENCIRQSIQIARRQSAKWWELRAAVSLARLLRHENRRDEARAMLADIYNWSTEGFDTADLRDAKALLKELKG